MARFLKLILVIVSISAGTFAFQNCSPMKAVDSSASSSSNSQSPPPTPPPLPPIDTEAPSIMISSPMAGLTLAAGVDLTAVATDNVGVVGVQFLVDGANYGAEVTAAPYTVLLNTMTLSNSPHQLSARARDAAGNTAQAAMVSVTLNNSTPDTTPPTVSITAPTDSATVVGTVAVAATAQARPIKV